MFTCLARGHTALLEWIEDHGYRVAGPFREIYIAHNHGDLTDSTTEIQFPVEKV